MNTSNSSIVNNFIEDIWNKNLFEKIDTYISNDYIDHSLPPNLAPNKTGMQQWITGTGKSFEHTTIIETIVSENNDVIIKIKLNLKHIGMWRNIEPTYQNISVVGYRCFKLKNRKIIAHWALIDGNAIENQLKTTKNGCKIQQ